MTPSIYHAPRDLVVKTCHLDDDICREKSRSCARLGTRKPSREKQDGKKISILLVSPARASTAKIEKWIKKYIITIIY